MRFIHYCCLLCVAMFAAQCNAGGSFSDFSMAGNDSVCVQGGWGYSRYLEAAMAFGDQLIQHAPDRYGPKPTPLWISVMNPDAPGLIGEKPANWQTYWDAEDYVMTAQGCNLYRDMPTLAALQELSQLTGEPRYQEAVAEYLNFYLQRLPSSTTGLFPWGEHMSYNTVRDTLYANRHEMEHNLPEWEMLWRVHSAAVQREIEAIYHINIYDKKQFLYDRHANYYTGALDPLPVRGSYIKHSGLYGFSFLFLYSKTHDPRHLHWAQKIANLYWQHRDPNTNLVPGYVSASGASGNSEVQLVLAYYLMAGLRFYPDPEIKLLALQMVDAVLQYGFDATSGEFASQLVPATGQALNGKTSVFSSGESSEYYRVHACLKAFRLTGEKRYLQAVQSCLDHLAQQPIPLSVSPQTIGAYIDLCVEVFHLSADQRYLRYGRSLANWSLQHLVRQGLIIEAANGIVYHNCTRPGVLLAAWLKLYEAERSLPLHWRAQEITSPRTGKIEIEVQTDAAVEAIELEAVLANQQHIRTRSKLRTGRGWLSLKLPKKVSQGPVVLRFYADTDRIQLGQGQLLITESSGPIIGPVSCPTWKERNSAVSGYAQVDDAAGIVKVICHYQAADTKVGAVVCEQKAAQQNLFSFTIPPLQSRADALTIQLEAVSNPPYPMTSWSAPVHIAIADVSEMLLASELSDSFLVVNGLNGFSLQGKTRDIRFKSKVRLSSIPINPFPLNAGLPELLLPKYIAVQPDSSTRGAYQLSLRVQLDESQISPILASTLSAFKKGENTWQRLADAKMDWYQHTITFFCDEGGVFAIGGQSRLGWRRTFNGSLLSSPAAARIDHQGRLAIVLDTRDPDRAVYCLDGQGKTLWTYEAGGMQPFPTVADLDNDSLDEIIIAGRKLVVLQHDGAVRWQAELPQSASAVVGNIIDGTAPEVIAVSGNGQVTAFACNGKELFRNQAGPLCQIPVLADLDGDGLLEIVVAGQKGLAAFSGKGRLLWQNALAGEPMYSPAAADLDQDGKEEVINFCRTDYQGFLQAFNGSGKLLWQATVSREPDWSPVVVAMQANQQPCILAQAVDPRQLAILDAQGRLLRNLATTGRLLQTPVPLDMTQDSRPDLLLACDLSYRVWALANDGVPLWSYTPKSFTLPGAKIKGGGSLLVADMDGDSLLEVVGGDDETWLNLIRTDLPCRPWQIYSGQYHGDSRHSGNYLKLQLPAPSNDH